MFLSIYLVLHRYYEQPKWRNWQTRTTQTRVPSGVWVRFPPSALLEIEPIQYDLDRFLSILSFAGIEKVKALPLEFDHLYATRTNPAGVTGKYTWLNVSHTLWGYWTIDAGLDPQKQLVFLKCSYRMSLSQILLHLEV